MATLEDAFPGAGSAAAAAAAGGGPTTVGALSRMLLSGGGNPEGAFHMQAGIRPGNNTPDLGLVPCPEYNGYCVPASRHSGPVHVPAPYDVAWAPAAAAFGTQ